MAGIRSRLTDDGAVLQEEVQGVGDWYFEVIYLFKKDLFIEVLKAEDFCASL